MHIDATRPGGAHDAHVLRMSNPGQRMEAGEVPQQMWLLGKWCKCNQDIYAVCAKKNSTNWPFGLMAIWGLLAQSKIYWPKHMKHLVIIHQNSCDGRTIKGTIFTGPSKINLPSPFYLQTPEVILGMDSANYSGWAHTQNDLLNPSRKMDSVNERQHHLKPCLIPIWLGLYPEWSLQSIDSCSHSIM